MFKRALPKSLINPKEPYTTALQKGLKFSEEPKKKKAPCIQKSPTKEPCRK